MVATEETKVRRNLNNETPKDGYIALIWEPAAAQKQQSGIDSMLTPDKLNFVPAYPMLLQTQPRGLGDDGLPLIENYFLKPGANLDVPLNSWNAIKEQKLVAAMVKDGRIREVMPSVTHAVDEIPGYRHYSESDAITLVKFTLHEDFVDNFGTDETRASVIKTMDEQKKKLADAKAKRML